MADMRFLEYLRLLDKVVIPEEFTYFVHNTLQGKNKESYDRMWEEMPTDSFTVKREMSFVERDSRVREALDYGGVIRAANSYRVSPNGRAFQIRVLMPKQRLTKEQEEELKITPEEKKLLDMEYRGLGDNRHPKLKNGEKVYIFASSKQDEISGQNIDILYGIREQDIERYARAVHKTLKREDLNRYTMPDRTASFKFGGDRGVAEEEYLNSVKNAYILDKEPISAVKPVQKVPTFEEKFAENYGDSFEASETLQIQDESLLRKLRMEQGVDPRMNRLEFYMVNLKDKEDDDFEGIGIYMRDRQTGKMKLINLPHADEMTHTEIVDMSRSAVAEDGKLHASKAEAMQAWRFSDGTMMTAFRRKDGKLCLGNNDKSNPKRVYFANTRDVIDNGEHDAR